jgi:hypothetical protein
VSIEVRANHTLFAPTNQAKRYQGSQEAEPKDLGVWDSDLCTDHYGSDVSSLTAVSARRFFRLGQRQFYAVQVAKVVSIQLAIYKSVTSWFCTLRKMKFST